MGYCRGNTAVKMESGNQIAVSLKCKSWTCPDCQPMRKRQLIAQGFGGTPNLFLTLTHRASDRFTPDEAAKRLSWAWRVLRLRLMRKYKLKHLPFIAVVEKHKSGWPHIHILLRSRYLDIFFIKKVMQELIDSPIARIERIQNKSKMLGYCIKYCGKAVQKFATAKRYWQSRDYDIRDPEETEHPDKKQGGWDLWQETIQDFVSGWESIGGKTEWISSDKAICYAIYGFS